MRKDREDPPRRRIRLANLAPGHRELSGEAAHYLRTVLRLGIGDTIACFDQGHEAIARICEIDRRRVKLDVGEPAPKLGAACRLTVALPAPKGERADWLVEKLTEIGAAEILWIECERGVTSPRPGGSRTSRWLRVAEAAARQCGRADVPLLCGPMPFFDALAQTAERYFVAAPGSVSLRTTLGATTPSSVILAIGPEGGFSGREMEKAAHAGYNSVSLGPWTLRVETAAVVGAGIILGT